MRVQPHVDALWLGLFHSISAFCNAGFSLFKDSLVGFRGDPTIVLCIGALVILGGLGFSVLAELVSHQRRSLGSFTLHSRLVLIVTSLLLAGGTLLFFFTEASHTMAGLSTGERLLASVFASITPRTAGFNTIVLTQMSQVGTLATVVLMFIGASPGSAGGGIKTSTLAVMVLAVKQLASAGSVSVMGRHLSAETVQKAFAITALSGATVLGFAGVLCLTEQAGLNVIVFEAVSAFATVGLSLDFTGQLLPVGRLLISVLMFVGRVGPLTVALALGEGGTRGNIQYPEGRVMIG